MIKKIFIFSLCLALGSSSFAQSLDDIGKLMDKAQFAAAKTAIDKYLGDAKNASNSDAWYYKGRIYNSLSRDAATAKADAYSLKESAFDAFKKHQDLDKKDMRMKLESYNSYLDLYLGLYDLGAILFNEKDFKGAYNSFSKAQDVENFILSKNYTYNEIKLNKLDTSLVMNTAAAALQATDSTNAVLHYKKIVDANLTAKEYEAVYEFLASYYRAKKDNANMQAIIAKGKAAYPQSNYWNELEILNASESGDKTAMFAKYEEVYKKDPTNFANTYNYAVELFNSLYAKEVKVIDETTANKLTEVLKAAIASDKGNDANALMTSHLFNYAADYSTRAALIKEGKLAKPADLKNKKDLTTKANLKMDEVIPYAEKSLAFFKGLEKPTARQKVTQQQTAGFLADIYRVKLNPKKSAEYDKLKDSIKF
jgi:hypothetical protein